MSEAMSTREPDADEELCLSDPPAVIGDPEGEMWYPGDCWCTLAPGHEGLCFCGPCTERYGAPGWPHKEGCCGDE
jgi:hypothetical protein